MTQSPNWQDFPLSEAIAALDRAGLLAAVLLPAGGAMAVRNPAVAATETKAAFLGARVDSRQLATGELFVALPGEHVHGRQFAADWLSVGGWVLTDATDGDDPLCAVAGVPGSGVLVCRDPQRALAELARLWRAAMPAGVVAVTGTNGKTTTKDFLAAALTGAGPTLATAGNFNNFLGLPLTLLALRPQHRFAVIEMGASAVGEIDFLAGLAAPSVGVITNASPAHLAEFGSLAAIIEGKGELLDHLPADGVAVLNADSPGFAEWQARARCPVVSLGLDAADHIWSAAVVAGQPTLQLVGQSWPVPLPGRHNAGNLAAAILAARALGAGDQEIRAGLAKFAGSPHRGVVLEIGGRVVLDDAYNANPASMIAAVAALLSLDEGSESTRTFAVLGHMAELGEDADEIHRETGRQLAASDLDILVAVGTAARPLSAGFDAEGGGGHYCAAVDEAARWLGTRTRPGDRILIKGSRSATMEEIIPLLATAFSGDPETQS